MHTPTVTVVIPTYGRAEFLKNLIESIRHSAPPSAIEIVVVSSDAPDSEKVVWLTNQADVQLILADNRGKGRRKCSLYHYTNLGCKKATMDWVLVMNDDMKMNTGWYETFTQLLVASKEKKVGMMVVAGHIGDVESGARTVKLGWTQKNNEAKKDLYLCDFSIINRNILKEIGYFDESLNWFGSGIDISLAINLLTDADVLVTDRIVIEHFITDEHRSVSAGDPFYDFNYIRAKWNAWCKVHNCQLSSGLLDAAESYTLVNRLKHYIRSIIKKYILFYFRRNRGL